MDSKRFWNQTFSRGPDTEYSRVGLPQGPDPVLEAALRHFGNIQGKRVVDLGCGSGKASLLFASLGSHVISIDQSDVAIANLRAFCSSNRITNVRAMHLSALNIAELGPVDFVFGSMILHHIEPFAAFVGALRSVLPCKGKAFFWENNAFSPLLIWFRQNVVGKLWVPKYGDDEEFPLMPREIDVLRRHFTVQLAYPDLVFFRLISQYLLRGHLETPFRLLDRIFYKWPAFRKRSYHQYVYLS